MPRRVIVILNAAAGSAQDAAPVKEALAAAGLDADVRAVPGHALAKAAAAAAREGPDAVVAAGGDGTVSAVAGALVGTGVPLGVLPLGTLNHFAKDAGVPLDLASAARTLAAGITRDVDVAEVNGHVFVNNSSIGIYPEMVRDRDAQRARSGRRKWLAMGIATLRVMRRFPHVHVVLDLPDRMLSRSTPFVFIGNNEYEARLTAPGRRARLDGGNLSVLTAHSPGRWGLARMMVASLLSPGPEPRAEGLDTVAGPEVMVASHKRFLHVAMDGEVVEMRPPLRYRILPRGLRIVAPPGGAA